MSPQQQKLEQQWWTKMSTPRGRACWDTLNELEDAIATESGETSAQVNQRLMQKWRAHRKAGKR